MRRVAREYDPTTPPTEGEIISRGGDLLLAVDGRYVSVRGLISLVKQLEEIVLSEDLQRVLRNHRASREHAVHCLPREERDALGL